MRQFLMSGRAFALAAALAMTSQAALANETVSYQPAAFTASQEAGEHVVIEVFKKGCGTCAAQQPALEEARKKFPGAVFIRVDFQEDLVAVKSFNAVKQSTIIVFKGKSEVARLVGETNADAIVSAIGKGA